jgi:methylenetetrahydrofolate reductase (NADPH)
MLLVADIDPQDCQAMHDDHGKQRLIDFLSNYATEVTPTQAARLENFAALLPQGTRVNVTFLPGSAFADTVATARLVKEAGYVPVPHFAARSIQNTAELSENLNRLQGEVGVSEALVIAGGLDMPLGDFDNSMQLLDTGLFEKYGIRKIGVAGHPEGSPDMSTDAIVEALQWKNAYARSTSTDMYITTQFCFEVAPVIAWAENLRRLGNNLPIHIGIPGPANLKTLINYARMCGIGPSMRVLSRQARNISKLMTISAPVALVCDLATYQDEQPDCQITQVHLYPLGGVQRMAEWLGKIQCGHFTMQPDRRHFIIDN